MAVVSLVGLTIEKGTDFEATFTLSGDDGGLLNLTETVASAKLKKHPTSPIGYDFTVGIVTSAAEVSIAMTNGLTSTLPAGRNYFDVFLTNISTSPSIVSRVVTGSIIVENTTLS